MNTLVINGIFFKKKEPLIVTELKEACDILLPPDVFITHWGKLAKGLAWYGKPGQFDTIEGAINDIDSQI